MFTKAQIREIAIKIGLWGKKDSKLPVTSNVSRSASVPVVQDGNNVLADVSHFMAENEIYQLKCDVIVNVKVPGKTIGYTVLMNGEAKTEGEYLFGTAVQIVVYAKGYNTIYTTVIAKSNPTEVTIPFGYQTIELRTEDDLLKGKYSFYFNGVTSGGSGEIISGSREQIMIGRGYVRYDINDSTYGQVGDGSIVLLEDTVMDFNHLT